MQGTNFNTKSAGGVGGNLGIRAPDKEEVAAAIESQLERKGAHRLDPTNPHDAKLINAFKALDEKQLYDLSPPADRDDERVAGLVGRNRTIVVQTIGLSGIPFYESGGKFTTVW